MFAGETSISSGRREVTPQVDVFPWGSCGPRIALGLAQVLEATEDSMVSGLQARLNPVWGGGMGFQCREHNPWLCLSPAGDFVRCFLYDPLWNTLFFVVFYILRLLFH